MKKVRRFLWRLIYDDCSYLLLNHFINHIPFWTIRKLLYIVAGMKIGIGSRIMMGCIVIRPSRIKIGKNNVINQNVLLDGRSDLIIGNNNSISMFSKIYTGTHLSFSDTFEYYGNKTIIHDNCWIGTNSVIMPGSELADFSILSVNSVYKGKSNPKDILMGVPAKCIRSRDIGKKYDLNFKAWFL